MPDILYPGARLMLLDPETRAEPFITPRIAVLHTHGFKGSSESLGRYWNRDDVHVEAHFSVSWRGVVYQFQHVNRQADAQGDGNLFCISIETEDDGTPSIPWSDDQVQAIAELLAWLNQEWDISLDEVQTWNGSGVGYHSKFKQWNKNAHACPGAVRVHQLQTRVLPLARILAQHDTEEFSVMDKQTSAYLDLQFKGIREHLDKRFEVIEETIAGRDPRDKTKRSFIGRIGDALKVKP